MWNTFPEHVQLYIKTCICVLYFNQQNVLNKIQENTYHGTNFTIRANSYMFRHQGAVLKELNNDKGTLSLTRTSDASRPHFHR